MAMQGRSRTVLAMGAHPMSLELLDTIATLTTTLIIAATAVAAIVQLRHLRAGNQIAAQLALRQVLLDTTFWNAIGRLRYEIPPLLRDPQFERYVREFHESDIEATGSERFDGPYEAALVVGRNLENIGNMVRNGMIDPRIFLEQYANLVVMAWNCCEPLVRIRREAVGNDAPWEDFEFLTVLARRFVQERPTVFPSGMKRILPPTAPKADAPTTAW